LVISVVAGCIGSTRGGASEDKDFDGVSAQFFEGMGGWDRRFTTSSEEANRFLVQGFLWLQCFNHDEAIRSFKEAARLDPNCAMAWWGTSFAEGPNYNDPFMTEIRNQASWDALQNASARIDNTAPWERDLIEALSARYEHPFPEDRKHLEAAYIEAMAKVWETYPDDPDIGAYYAEAMMVERPWALYSLDREAVEGTEKIVETLERVLELDPDHPGACHLYIHSVEQSKTPERALLVADRLCRLVPASGHMLHMPSHIYTRVNMWDRSITQNALAMEADERYRKLSPEQGLQHMYMIHNSHILAYSAMMVGRSQEALAAARRMWSDPSAEILCKIAPMVDMWMCSVYDVQKRFGMWRELLEEEGPPKYMPITRAIWKAHRAIAYAALKDFDSALAEYAEFERLYNNPPPTDRLFPGWTQERFQKRLDAIRHFVPGEIALQRGSYDLAIRHLEKAVQAEDQLGYGGEPPEYLQPIRHTLGAVYIKAGRPEDAERAYLEDLDEFPGNGWSLYGLSEALRAQEKLAEAQRARRQYQIAWARADVPPLTTSCMCIEQLRGISKLESAAVHGASALVP
jgi:tetratricopeptide (TPR) repeat protein